MTSAKFRECLWATAPVFYCFFVNIVVKSKQHAEDYKWSTAKLQSWIPCRGAFTAQLRVWILSLHWTGIFRTCQTSKMLFAKIFAEIFQNSFFAEQLRVTVLDSYHLTSARKFTFQKHTSNIYWEWWFSGNSRNEIYWSSHRACSEKRGVLKNLANFTGKHLRRSFFLKELQTWGLQLY